MKSIEVVKESSSAITELPVSQFGSSVELYIILDLNFQKIKVSIETYLTEKDLSFGKAGKAKISLHDVQTDLSHQCLHKGVSDTP